MTNKIQPHLFILSGPSGVGKTTVAKEILKQLPQMQHSISYTTRPRRSDLNEQHGTEYYFVDVATFQQMIAQQDFLEWAEVYGNYYGTSKTTVQKILQAGKHVLLVIDVQGAESIRQLKIPQVASIFLEPPSLKILKQRLTLRATEDHAILTKRLAQAEHELSLKNQYDIIIKNDHLKETTQAILNFISKIETSLSS